MTKRIALSVARDRLSSLVNEVAHGKCRLVLESHGKAKAALVCLEDLQRLEAHGEVAARPDTEMMRWLAQTEELLRPSGSADASTEALDDVRQELVAEKTSVYRRKRRSKASGRRES